MIGIWGNTLCFPKFVFTFPLLTPDKRGCDAMRCAGVCVGARMLGGPDLPADVVLGLWIRGLEYLEKHGERA